jgi:N-methylhydantoinase B
MNDTKPDAMRNDPIDPITLEVIRNRLDAIAQEMQDALVRSGYSNIIKEGHDCSASLFDAKGELIAQATALPAQLGVLPPAVARVLKSHPAEEMADGDVFILNDPYDGGTHLPDIAVITPVMFEGRAVAIAACIAHHQDVGGKTPGSLPTDSTDIFQEGLRIPLARLYEAGKPNELLHAFIERNVRIPEIVLGDLRAQLSALHVGKRRLADLMAAYGTAQASRYFDELLDRAEELTRRSIGRLRPGTYSFEDYLDDDGVVRDKLVKIRATVTISERDLHVDFTGTDPQLKGPINADCSAVLSSVYFVVKSITDPAAPNNGGCYRPVRVTLPEGSVVNPRPPAPVNGRTITMKRICDAILGALVHAMPDEMPAAPGGVTRVMVFGGRDPESGRQFVCTDFTTSGTGGQPGQDGVDALETDIANTMTMPVESLELHFPVRVRRNALWQDSGGAGRWRGGLGVEREIEILRGEITLTLREDRHRSQAWGLYGGGPPPLSHSDIVRADGTAEDIPSKGVFSLSAGDSIHCRGPGGAGYGDPLTREPQSVLQDVIDRKVSIDSALSSYGVVIDPEHHTIDTAATAQKRAAMTEERGAIDWTYDRGEKGRS